MSTDPHTVVNVARRCLTSVALVTLLGACQPVPPSPVADERAVELSRDAALQSALTGQWTWQFIDDTTRSVITIDTRRDSDGTWSEQAIERTRGAERAVERVVYVRSGRWFVTEGVLKTRTTQVDGLSVGANSRLAFQTYPIVSTDERRVVYRVAKENGHPGQWPRVIESPGEFRDKVTTVIETRVER